MAFCDITILVSTVKVSKFVVEFQIIFLNA